MSGRKAVYIPSKFRKRKEQQRDSNIDDADNADNADNDGNDVGGRNSKNFYRLDDIPMRSRSTTKHHFNSSNINNTKKSKRFHGAFTGGFSAGYFNTVGTREGWKPITDEERKKKRNISSSSSSKKQQEQQQRLEELMDEQDFEEWGGPTKLRKEYHDDENDSTVHKKRKIQTQQSQSTEPSLALTVTSQNSNDDDHNHNAPTKHHPLGESSTVLLDDLFQIKRQGRIGSRLLRQLGWREGSNTAFVPTSSTATTKSTRNGVEQSEEKTSTNENEIDDTKTIILSKKRLREIQIQSVHAKIPVPKLDKCGLGYEPYHNAPEFRRFKEQRQRLARRRLLEKSASTTTRHLNGSDSGAGVYRVSDILHPQQYDNDVDNDNNDALQQQRRMTQQGAAESGNTTPAAGTDIDSSYIDYETAEDFVGTKSASGFALRDDDDHAYDDDDVNVASYAMGKVATSHPLLGSKSDQSIHHHPSSKATAAAAAAAAFQEEYNTEAYEHHDSGSSDNDVDDDHDSENHRHHHHHRQSSRTTHEFIADPSLAAAIDEQARPNNSHTNKKQSIKMANAIGSALSSWANLSSTKRKHDGSKSTDGKVIPSPLSSSTVLASDGKPPLDGFVLGSSSIDLQKIRYLGPDIPRSYRPSRHVFSENEHPKVYQTISRAIELQQQQSKRQQRIENFQIRQAERRRQQQLQQQQRHETFIHNNQFSNLAQAMKNRFTTSQSDTTTTSVAATTDEGVDRNESTQRVGLYYPNPMDLEKYNKKLTEQKRGQEYSTNNNNNNNNSDKNDSQGKKEKLVIDMSKLKVTRATSTFIPHPLVCKRFDVQYPKHIVKAVAGATTSTLPATSTFAAAGVNNNNNHNSFSKGTAGLKEAMFFEKEVLSTIKRHQQQQQQQQQQQEKVDSTSDTTTDNGDKNYLRKRQAGGKTGYDDDNDDDEQDGVDNVPLLSERPSLQELKSIFEPQYDVDDDDESDDDENDEKNVDDDKYKADEHEAKSNQNKNNGNDDDSSEPDTDLDSIGSSIDKKSDQNADATTAMIKYRYYDNEKSDIVDDDNDDDDDDDNDRKETKKKKKERKQSRHARKERARERKRRREKETRKSKQHRRRRRRRRRQDEDEGEDSNDDDDDDDDNDRDYRTKRSNRDNQDTNNASDRVSSSSSLSSIDTRSSYYDETDDDRERERRRRRKKRSRSSRDRKKKRR